MNKLLKLTASLILFVAGSLTAKAQRYDNLYNASTASLLQVQDSSRIEHTLKGATVIFPNGSNELNVSINIPYYAVDNKPVDDTDFVNPGYMFRLKVNVDVNEIQEVLTSEKRFSTHGFLTLNNITKEVDVSYMPMASGTEENGNFNVYMNVRFIAADFNLDTAGSKREFVISLNNAKVNRI